MTQSKPPPKSSRFQTRTDLFGPPPRSERPLALVTGASSGIGYELARQLAQHGHDLLIASDHEGTLREAAQGLVNATGTHVEPVTCDLATRDGVERLAAVARDTGPVDVLCCNAGAGIYGDFVETDLEAELRIIQLNAASVVHLTKLMLPDMLARHRGRILITASTDSTTPDPYLVVYAATKAFVLSFAEAIRHSLQDTGITVTALLPGPTDTNFFRRAGMQRSKVNESAKSDPAEVASKAYRSLMRGDDHTIVGWKNKAQVAMQSVLSDPVKAALTAEQTRPKRRA